MSDSHKATFWVQLEPSFSPYNDEQVTSVKAVTVTQKRPTSQRPGTALAKLTVSVPDAAFLPLRPATAILISADMIAAATPLEVDVEPVD